MTDFPAVVERYLDAFNETDPARRRTLLEELCDGECTYVDPQVAIRGPEQIDEFIAGTQAAFPGFVFRLGSPIDAHHSQARFQWHAGPPEEAEPAFVGFDVIVAEGDLVRGVYGFIDHVPAA